MYRKHFYVIVALLFLKISSVVPKLKLFRARQNFEKLKDIFATAAGKLHK